MLSCPASWSGLFISTLFLIRKSAAFGLAQYFRTPVSSKLGVWEEKGQKGEGLGERGRGWEGGNREGAGS